MSTLEPEVESAVAAGAEELEALVLEALVLDACVLEAFELEGAMVLETFVEVAWAEVATAVLVTCETDEPLIVEEAAAICEWGLQVLRRRGAAETEARAKARKVRRVVNACMAYVGEGR